MALDKVDYKMLDGSEIQVPVYANATAAKMGANFSSCFITSYTYIYT